MITAEELIQTESNFFSDDWEEIEMLMNKFTLVTLKEIFEDGLGELDENCSKDDLVEHYLEYKKMLE